MSNIGAVIIANNTDKFDYEKLAAVCAAKVERNLRIPTTIINVANEHNQRYVKFGRVDWLNMGRTQAYQLSPYDKTLLIDADLFIHTDALSNHLVTAPDFAIAREIYNPVTGHKYVKKLGKTQIDQVWATAIIFEKCPLAQNVFELAQHVLDHYDYYHLLYNFTRKPMRNDYAFSIACHILGGYGQRQFDIQSYVMPNCDFETSVVEINDDNVLVNYRKDQKTLVQRIKSDVHIQDKASLFGLIDDKIG